MVSFLLVLGIKNNFSNKKIYITKQLNRIVIVKSSSGVINNCKWEVVNCDCREYMREMVKNNIEVDCIITSPPYFNRRSYGAKPKVDGNIAKWLYASSGKPIENEIGKMESALK